MDFTPEAPWFSSRRKAQVLGFKPALPLYWSGWRAGRSQACILLPVDQVYNEKWFLEAAIARADEA
jgi:hypothetical protein